ncbi:SRPBCC family protein [Rhodococcus aetherivorans]
MTTTPCALSDLPDGVIPGVVRIETSDREATTPVILDMLRSVYPHEQMFGQYCTVHGYIAALPDGVYDYLAHTRSLEEWTYSLRGFAPTDQPGLWSAHDRLGSDTTIYTRTVAHPEARTVDYHCAWDQGEHLWMIYLMRVVDAQTVLDKPGTVVLWTNCHHPFYDRNPYPHTAPPDRRAWVGDFWDMFAAGHRLELNNLTALCEYRARHRLPLTPAWMSEPPPWTPSA